ncbi:hypothetical protein BGZ96_009264 [Linnemannia gamsii]|uniref:Uncharacterized protein n=1 Tax=Linnemannia gamsii TaxID=64522 RepID=A0ABQ7JYP0_9FUNG|nr:hypothetical protein BGZ96_009264 [Linnemannia gamsii]
MTLESMRIIAAQASSRSVARLDRKTQIVRLETKGPGEEDGGETLADRVPLLADKSSGGLTILEIEKGKDVFEDLWDTEGEL